MARMIFNSLYCVHGVKKLCKHASIFWWPIFSMKMYSFFACLYNQPWNMHTGIIVQRSQLVLSMSKVKSYAAAKVWLPPVSCHSKCNLLLLSHYQNSSALPYQILYIIIKFSFRSYKSVMTDENMKSNKVWLAVLDNIIQLLVHNIIRLTINFRLLLHSSQRMLTTEQ